MKSNIILIGMPASGKSTVGVILAKLLGKDFVDTDLLIQKTTGKLLPQIISECGAEGFITLEGEVCAGLDVRNAVIATGGSAVYSADGMANLKRIGAVVYLRARREDLFRRLHDIRQRGVVLREGQTLDALFDERAALYERYADLVIDENGGRIEDTVNAVLNALQAEPEAQPDP